MPHAIVISAYGGPENLVYKEVAPKKLAPTEVRVKNTAIGVNYIDVYYRTGLYPFALPLIPGVEAAGVVEEVGIAVTDVSIGDRVCYGSAPGVVEAYATHTVIEQKFLIKIPLDVTDEVAATLMVKGLTANYLLNRTFMVLPDSVILVHAAAGGVGTYLCQLAKFYEAKVIGTVSSDEKAKWAQDNGCTHPIVYTREDFVKKTLELTGGKGVPVVYDSVGKDTFRKSLECLCPLGLLVSYGQSSGKVPPFDILELGKKSNFLTRPSLAFYNASRSDLVMAATDVFTSIRQNVLKPRITHRIALKDAGHAHKLLESKATMGSIVLIP